MRFTVFRLGFWCPVCSRLFAGVYLPALVCVDVWYVVECIGVTEVEDEQDNAEPICVTRLSNMVEVEVCIIHAVFVFFSARLDVTEGNWPSLACFNVYKNWRNRPTTRRTP